MDRFHARMPRTGLRRWWVAGLATLAGISFNCLQPALAAIPSADRDRPQVPSGLDAPSDSKLFRVEHAIGTQNYVCLLRAVTTVPVSMARAST